MVTVDLIGRLGNQMFQIATCAAQAWRTNQMFVIPKHSLNVHIWPTYFPNIQTKTYNGPLQVWREPSHAYTPIPTDWPDMKLHGYFQSEKYFQDYKNEIFDLFAKELRKTRKAADCAIHIRLGDYKQMQYKHPVISTEYLDKAIDTMIEKTKRRNFNVFSDEIDTAKIMIQSLRKDNCNFYYVRDIYNPKEALSVMSDCPHQICANSSFSWWAAWLNQNPEKIVIMPRQWFGPGNAHLETKDIYPEGAIVI